MRFTLILSTLRTVGANLPLERSDPAPPQTPKVEQDSEYEEARVFALIALAPYISQELQPQILESLLCKEDKWAWTQVFTTLPTPLSPELVQQQWSSAKNIQEEEERVKVLAEIVAYLPPELLQEAWEIAQEIEDEEIRSEALSSLLPALPSEMQQELWEHVQYQESLWTQLEVWQTLAPRLSTEQRHRDLQRFLEMIQKTEDEKIRSQTLSFLVADLPLAVLPMALQIAESLTDEPYEWTRYSALISLAPYLPAELLPQALVSAQSIGFK